MLLLALYPVLVAVIFWIIVFLLGMGSTKGMLPQAEIDPLGAAQGAVYVTIEFLPLILTAVAIWFMIAWFSHSAMIRKLAHSHPVSREEEAELYNLLENLCISRGIKMPRLEIIETHARNAFASGIDDKSYCITVTRGLMNSLQKDELEGVLAHELTHIMNRDVRLLIVCVIFTGMFGFLAQLAWSNIRYSLFYSRGRRDNAMATIIAMLVIAVVLWLGYLATLMMRFALSRRREYMADAGAIELTKNPEAMMRALMRISGRDRIPETTDDIAMMCVENHVPFLGMFATHPPIQKRIEAISAVTNTNIPDSASLPPVSKKERFIRDKDQDGERLNPWLIRGRRK